MFIVLQWRAHVIAVNRAICCFVLCGSVRLEYSGNMGSHQSFLFIFVYCIIAFVMWLWLFATVSTQLFVDAPISFSLLKSAIIATKGVFIKSALFHYFLFTKLIPVSYGGWFSS